MGISTLYLSVTSTGDNLDLTLASEVECGAVLWDLMQPLGRRYQNGVNCVVVLEEAHIGCCYYY